MAAAELQLAVGTMCRAGPKADGLGATSRTVAHLMVPLEAMLAGLYRNAATAAVAGAAKENIESNGRQPLSASSIDW